MKTFLRTKRSGSGKTFFTMLTPSSHLQAVRMLLYSREPEEGLMETTIFLNALSSREDWVYKMVIKSKKEVIENE